MTDRPLSVSSQTNPSTDQLISRILSEIHQRYGLDLSEDPAAMDRIREAVEQAALELQIKSETFIELPFISATGAGPIHLKRRVTREEYAQADLPGDRLEESHAVEDSKPERTRVQLPDRKPVVTIALLVVMAALYLMQLLTQFLFYQDLPAALGMKINQAIIDGQYWRLVTPMFLHGGILHLGFNLYALYILGRRIERYFGHWRFLGLFLISGIAGNLFSFLFTDSPSLGSSTAIFGLLAAEGVFIYQHRKLFGDRFGTALRQIIQVAVINFIIGLSPGIDNWGHFGGLLGGIAFTWFGGPAFELQGTPPILGLQDRRPEKKTWWIFLLELILLVILTAWVIITRQ